MKASAVANGLVDCLPPKVLLLCRRHKDASVARRCHIIVPPQKIGAAAGFVSSRRLQYTTGQQICLVHCEKQIISDMNDFHSSGFTRAAKRHTHTHRSAALFTQQDATSQRELPCVARVYDVYGVPVSQVRQMVHRQKKPCQGDPETETLLDSSTALDPLL
ncbi:hypothetical protein JOB18_008927 [Solea senegalensis]|uniref:Uncharacterized protein n=1 Tax=Solea senegalensis TaxID=28829 RepID=A0AAV6T4E8_SOLSE|nr:hypothetical protein JOB18_008927 [Solea senegalensis]